VTTRAVRRWLVAPLAILVVASAVAGSASGADPVPGSAGVDTSIPATDSQVTVKGRGRFADLEITVNQTRNLTTQAVSVTWKGGSPTLEGPGRFASNYMQIFQCWGDDDGTVPDNPGPPPEQCVQGAIGGQFGGLPGGLFPAGVMLSRVISREGWANFDPSRGVLDPKTKNLWLPFNSVSGQSVPIQVNSSFSPEDPDSRFWLNDLYNIITTNEIPGGATGPDGTGAELMQLLTGVQSTGLGCGQRVQPTADGGRKVPRCWIVVVPRGTPTEENVGTPFEVNADQAGVATSPVAPTSWANRIAIPLEFNPIDSPCSLQNDERRLVGNELFFPAIASWQPALCATPGAPPYSYAPVSDASARRQLLAPGAASSGMSVISKPLEAETVKPSNPVVYAPLAGLGLVVGFNYERLPNPSGPEAAQRLAGVRVAEMNLTPRLVAKLLTQSYTEQLNINSRPPYEWDDSNPPHLGQDPDFVRFNPEFELLLVANARTFGGLSLPAGNSDAAAQVWEWILEDPEARAWMDGQPDEWGMRVNPIYSTSDELNPSGISFAASPPTSFPKGDPYCYQAPTLAASGVVPPLLCGTDWLPYARGFGDVGQIVRTATDGARIVENPFALTPSDVWKREAPQFVGRRAMLGLTDTATATQFGLQVARLSRAGDNGPEREFVAPDGDGLTKGLATLKPRSDPGFLEPSTEAAPGAYPLTTLVYGAVTPLSLDADARDEYADLIEYAAGPGQTQGLAQGQLPRGYVPLNETLRAQALSAATSVRSLTAPPPAPVPPPPPQTQLPAPTNSTSGSTRGGQSSRPTPAAEQVVEESPPPETEEDKPVEPADETVADADDAPAVLTPILAVGRSRYAVAGLGVVALASLLGALEITKRPRRRTGQLDPTAAGGLP
jgi:hypothetical protein